MTNQSSIAQELEALRQVFPDPFSLPAGLTSFFAEPVAQQLLADGPPTAQRLVAFLESNPEPSLARVAVILLSRFAPTAYYSRLLTILEHGGQALVEAFDLGLWLIQLPPEQIAGDLVRLVATAQTPYPLLLLQRPQAQAVRRELAEFIRQRQLPLSLFALYSYRYTLEPSDVPLLSAVAEWRELPSVASLAGIYLLRLGSTVGIAGIRAGLSAADEAVRMITYYELASFLPQTSLEEARFDPARPADAQQTAIEMLINQLRDYKE